MRNLKNIFVIIMLSIIGFACERDSFFETDLQHENLVIKNGKSQNETGFDPWGYNWNAHHFSGYVINAWLGDNLNTNKHYYHWEPYQGNPEAYLEIHPEIANEYFWNFTGMTMEAHWNEELCSSNGVYPETWINTNAWITFHYRSGKGKTKWDQFQKFIAVSSNDTLKNKYFDPYGNLLFGEWYNADDELIGYHYQWYGLALIQVQNVGNVPDGMMVTYKSPMSPGIGKYKKLFP